MKQEIKKKTTMKAVNNKALRLAQTALRQTDDAIQKFVSRESLPEPLDCKPGCYFCCYNLPMITPPEALFMGHYVEQTFSEQKKEALAGNIDKILRHIDGLSPYEVIMKRHELPCIFLENGMCSVYQVRPVVCRTCTSTSAEHCKMIFETQNHRARLRCYQYIREIFQTVQTDLINSCRKLGCQPDLVHIAEGIRDYSKHPNPVQAWLDGEIVFTISG